MTLEIGTVTLSMDEIAERLSGAFAGELTGVRVQEPDTVVARLERTKLKDVARRLKELPDLAYETLNWIAGVDLGAELESVYHVYSWHTNTYLELHVAVPRAKAELDTVTGVWPAADWHERESWDMMGIRYVGHPDLRRILLKDDFVGHPLRKDYIDLAENHPHA
jgi:NADH-quinone oxidoreductase subunit C